MKLRKLIFFFVLNSILYMGMASTHGLALSEIEDIEETIVTASGFPSRLRLTGSSVSVLTKDDILSTNQYNLANLLRYQPSVGVSNSGGLGKSTALRIRGEESYRTQIYIDGIKVSDPTAPQVGPSVADILSSGISRIEIIRGPQGLIYGADSGGIVNVITDYQANDKLEAGIDTKFGAYNTSQLSGNVKGKVNHITYSVNATRLGTDGFNARSDDFTADDDGYTNSTFHSVLSYSMNAHDQIKFVYRDVSGDNYFDNCGFPTVHHCKDSNDTNFYKLSTEFKLKAMVHQFSLGRTRVGRESGTTDKATFTTDGKIDRVKYSAAFQLSPRMGAFIVGSEYEKEDITTSGNKIDRDQLSYYVEYQNHWDSYYVKVGGRNDHHEDFGKHTSFRVTHALLREMGAWKIKMHSSIGNGFRAPSISEIAYNMGPNALGQAKVTVLKEEKSFGYDIGLQLQNAGLQLELIYFNQSIDDEIYFDLVGYTGYLQGSSQSQSKGLELIMDYQVSDRLNLTHNLTWNQSQKRDGSERLRRPKLLGHLGLDYRATEQISLGIDMRFSKNSMDTNNYSLNDYAVMNFNVNYQHNGHISFYMNIDNLLNHQYQEVNLYNTAGSSFYLGCRVNF